MSDVLVPTHLVQAVLPAEKTIDLSLLSACREMGGFMQQRTCLIDLDDTELWIRTSKAYGCDYVYACVCVHRVKLTYFIINTAEETA